MPGTPSTARRDTDSAIEAAWTIVLATSRGAEAAARTGLTTRFALSGDGDLVPVGAGHPQAVVAWRAGAGWESTLPFTDPRRALIDLYLPITSATSTRPVTIGHLGQSLDGFIATHSGESQYVTGEENILHLHRMRALCDAVIVGAGTVAADDPQLTTRKVPGPSRPDGSRTTRAGLGPATRRTVNCGSSATAVPTPTTIASTRARRRCRWARPAGPLM